MTAHAWGVWGLVLWLVKCPPQAAGTAAALLEYHNCILTFNAAGLQYHMKALLSGSGMKGYWI